MISHHILYWLWSDTAFEITDFSAKSVILPQDQSPSFFNTEKPTQSHSNVQDLKNVDLRDSRNLFENIKRIFMELSRAPLSLNQKNLLAKGVISPLLILIIKKGIGKNVLRLNPWLLVNTVATEITVRCPFQDISGKSMDFHAMIAILHRYQN